MKHHTLSFHSAPVLTLDSRTISETLVLRIVVGAIAAISGVAAAIYDVSDNKALFLAAITFAAGTTLAICAACTARELKKFSHDLNWASIRMTPRHSNEIVGQIEFDVHALSGDIDILFIGAASELMVVHDYCDAFMKTPWRDQLQQTKDGRPSSVFQEFKLSLEWKTQFAGYNTYSVCRNPRRNALKTSRT